MFPYDSVCMSHPRLITFIWARLVGQHPHTRSEPAMRASVWMTTTDGTRSSLMFASSHTTSNADVIGGLVAFPFCHSVCTRKSHLCSIGNRRLAANQPMHYCWRETSEALSPGELICVDIWNLPFMSPEERVHSRVSDALNFANIHIPYGVLLVAWVGESLNFFLKPVFTSRLWWGGVVRLMGKSAFCQS